MIGSMLGGLSGIGSLIGNSVVSGLNYQSQQQNLAYLKDLQQQLFARDDDAVYRKTLDLERSGLSKTLAVGSSAGTSGAISTAPSQRQGVDVGALQAMQMMKMDDEIHRARSENQLIDIQKERARVDLDMAKFNNDWYKKRDLPSGSLPPEAIRTVNSVLESGKDIVDKVGRGVSKFKRDYKEFDPRKVEVSPKQKEFIERRSSGRMFSLPF